MRGNVENRKADESLSFAAGKHSWSSITPIVFVGLGLEGSHHVKISEYQFLRKVGSDTGQVLALGARVCDGKSLVKESEVDKIDPLRYTRLLRPLPPPPSIVGRSPSNLFIDSGLEISSRNPSRCGLFCCPAMCVISLPRWNAMKKSNHARAASLSRNGL